MPNLLEDLVIDRVDFVDEGANSAAFIELYKRKEQSPMELKEILSKMKPEHAAVVEASIEASNEELRKAKEDLATVSSERDTIAKERDDANAALATANEDLSATKSELETLKAGNGAAFDESEVLKSMPQAAREAFEKMKAQKEAAEEEIRKAKEERENAEAIAKANTLKAIPMDHEKLVSIVKRADEETFEALKAASEAIENGVLGEVGKSHRQPPKGTDAWSQIEAKSEEIAKRDGVDKAKAIAIAVKENPDLYQEYLKGGAN